MKVRGGNGQNIKEGQCTKKETNYGVSYHVITSYLSQSYRGVQGLSFAPRTVEIGKELMEKRRK
jgi:hypothetical protein